MDKKGAIMMHNSNFETEKISDNLSMIINALSLNILLLVII